MLWVVQVLCDLAVHADFINQWLEAVHTKLGAGPKCETQSMQSDGFLLLQDQQVPDSYVAGLVRGTSLQQVQQMLSMTPQDWADEMTAWFTEVMVQVELLTRPNQATAAATSDQALNSSAAGSAHHAMQQQLLQKASAPSGPGTGGTPCGTAPAALPGAAPPVQRSNSSGSWSTQHSNSSGSWSLQCSGSGASESLLRRPINVSPAHAREALVAVVGRGIHLIILSTVLGRMVHIAGEAILTGGAVDSDLEDAEAITDRLQLTELQELHPYICMTE
jgi:hypothetical protein